MVPVGPSKKLEVITGVIRWSLGLFVDGVITIITPTFGCIGFTIRNPCWSYKPCKWIPSWELTYPPKMAVLKMIFLFPRWDMLIPWSYKPYKWPKLNGFHLGYFWSYLSYLDVPARELGSLVVSSPTYLMTYRWVILTV